MALFQNKYRIESTRLPFYDYSSDGFYFVTICTKNRECYFGKIIDYKMQYTAIGNIARKYWLEIPKHFPFVVLDEFMVMPNHLHGIIGINKDISESVETQNLASLRERDNNGHHNEFGPQSKNLASIIRGFKIGVKKYAAINGIEFFWQPRFYDHIIREGDEIDNIRQYIVNNPANWEYDRNNSEGLLM